MVASGGVPDLEDTDMADLASVVCLGDGQSEAYLKDMGVADLASAWAMARQWLGKYRRKVDAVARCSGVCPPEKRVPLLRLRRYSTSRGKKTKCRR